MNAIWGKEDDRIPKEWRRQYLQCERSNAQLRKDMTVAFDRIHELQRKVDRQGIELWVYRLVVGGAAAAITMLWTSLSSCWQALK